MAILITLAVIIALAAADNALTPEVSLSRTGTAPPSFAVVRTLVNDDRAGTLLAGTSAGVYRSDDGGDTWNPSSNGLTSIDIQTLVADPRTGDWYSAAYAGTVFRSTDGARTWQFAGRGLPSGELMTVAYDGQTGTLYAGLRGYGLYTSKNSGATWETVGFGLSNMQIRALLTGPQPSEAFAATDRGVYHSQDLGATWEDLTSKLPDVSATALIRDARDARDARIYAGTERGVLQFTPAGAQFNAAPAGLDGMNVQSLALDPADGALVAGTLGNGVFRTLDGGTHWTPMNDGLRSTLVRALLAVARDGQSQWFAGTDSGIYRHDAAASRWREAAASPIARYGLALLIDPRDGTVLAGTRGGVFASVDGGTSWQSASTGLDNANAQALGLDTGAGVAYAGTPRGLHRASSFEAGWNRAGAALADVNVQTLAVDERNGIAYAVSDMGDTYRSANAGADWQIVEALQPVFARTVIVSAYRTAVYVGAYRGGVAVSYDKGLHWQRIGNDLPDRNVEALAIDERNGAVYAGTLGGAVFRKVNDGESWQRQGDPLPNPIVALAIDEQSDAVMAATKIGVYRLPKGQAQWQPAMTGLGGTIAFALAARRPGTLYAGIQGAGLHRSDNGGQTWRPINNGLSDADMHSLAVHPAGTTYAALAGLGVFRTDDAGATWQPVNAGLHSLDVRAVALDLRDESLRLVAADGVYQSVDGGASWQPAETGLPNLLDLALPFSTFGYAGRMPGGQQVWAVSGGGALWARMAASLGLNNAAIQLRPDGTGALHAAWGAGLRQSESGAGYGRIPLGWLWTRVIIWRGLNWLTSHTPWWWVVPAAGLLLATMVALIRHARLAYRFGAPLGRSLVRPNQMARLARPQALDKAWAQWEPWVQDELFRFGDLKPMDVPRIPGPFRLYALRRYFDQHSPDQLIELDQDHVWTTAGDRPREWHRAWQAISTSLKRPSAGWLKRDRVNDLAAVLGKTLNLKLGLPRDADNVRAYGADGRAPEPLPPHVAVLFVADNEPNARTIKSLIRTLDGFKMDGAIGLIVPLAGPKRQQDVPNRLRAVLSKSDDAQRLVVMSNADIMGMLISRQPARTIERLIMAKGG